MRFFNKIFKPKPETVPRDPVYEAYKRLLDLKYDVALSGPNELLYSELSKACGSLEEALYGRELCE